MQSFLDLNYPPTVILRHQKENLKKCSLRGLETRPDFRFFTFPKEELPLLKDYIMLSLEAPPLTIEDAPFGLLVLDGTWRYAGKMFTKVTSHQQFKVRSLPNGWKTAYPRRQDDCPLPDQGLASIEAIYAAYSTLGRDTAGLLDNYHWKEQFLKK